MTRTVTAAVVVTIVAAGGATAWWLAAPHDGTHAAASVPVATVPVVRTTLTATTQLSGTLGFAGSYAVTPELHGTITALPAAGSVVRRGEQLYEVDGAGVLLFYGQRPAWRDFAIGMTPGVDVRELEQNLVVLGYGGGLTVDDTFAWATDRAVRAWQRATGQPVTGRVDFGRVVFIPDAVRITTDGVPLGAPAQPGQPVLTVSSPDPVVTVPVPATQTYLVHVGDAVTVTVPSGATATGRVAAISPVASASPDSQSGGNGPPPASVPATVTLDNTSVAAGLDQAPVTISVVDQRVDGVLAVPVTSLVALAGGGYAVWVDASGARRLVGVTPGLFAQTLVQVTAPGLHVGDHVEVPAP